MSLKSILVHLDSSAQSAARLDYAVALARHYKARLTGLFARLASAQTVGLVASWPSARYTAAAAESRQQFLAATAGLDGAEWRDANRGSAVEVVKVLVRSSFLVDLVVLGQDDENNRDLLPEDLAEQVVMNAGRPVLMIPVVPVRDGLAEHGFALPWQRPVLAWSNTRESVRAVNDSIPLLRGCSQAHLVALGQRSPAAVPAGGSGSSGPGDAAGLYPAGLDPAGLELARLDQAGLDSAGGICRHMELHGVSTTLHRSPAEGLGVMDALLNVILAEDGDLLVLGASGSTGFAGFRRRSGTRHILRQMFVPVLMSH